jgi:predicted RecA/RadA family phage recombinase
MATNTVFEGSITRSLAATHPATPASGDPVRVGAFCGVALTDERDDGTTTIALDGTHDVSVKGVNGGGNSAVAVGDEIFYTDGDTPVLNKKTTGVHFGYAEEAVASGATTTIRVRVTS